MLRIVLSLVTAGAVLASAARVCAADLRLVVTGLRGDDGAVAMALYAGPREWPEGPADIQVWVTPVHGEAAYVFKDLAPGRYAATGFHDENGNRVHDTNFLGLPLEGFFLSNDVRPVLASPRFSACAFDLPPAGLTVTAHMNYWTGRQAR